jgi:putative membrane protein
MAAAPVCRPDPLPPHTPRGTLGRKEMVTVMNGYGMGLLWLWTLLVVVGVIAVVWGLVRATSATPPSAPSGQERARDILRERFARGEITEQELRERLRVLDDH